MTKEQVIIILISVVSFCIGELIRFIIECIKENNNEN